MTDVFGTVVEASVVSTMTELMLVALGSLTQALQLFDQTMLVHNNKEFGKKQEKDEDQEKVGGEDDVDKHEEEEDGDDWRWISATMV